MAERLQNISRYKMFGSKNALLTKRKKKDVESLNQRFLGCVFMMLF